MPRKHGARAVAAARKNIARSKKIPVAAVTLARARQRLSVDVQHIGPVAPGFKVRPYRNETFQATLRRFKKAGGRGAGGRGVKTHAGGRTSK